MPRPSGHAIIDEATALVFVTVAEIEKRGRLNILPRWRAHMGWLAAATTDVEALMVFSEPGLLSIRSWHPDGPRIQKRFAQLAASSDPDAEGALRLIQDRYQRLKISPKERTSLGNPALAHLGFSIDRRASALVYVSVFKDRIELMSPQCRDTKLNDGHILVDDLP
jgi:hypothetical protein